MNNMVKTYWARIYLGLREGYDGTCIPKETIMGYLRQYCEIGFAVNVQDTHFIYTGGGEPGLVIELINYPRFPSKPAEVQKHAFEIANDLKILARQERLSIVTPDSTFLIEENRLTLSGLKRMFPKLFSTCWEMSVDPGWYDIVWNTSKLLADNSNCEVLQIKQKLGGLSYYIQGGSKLDRETISEAVALASRTCESCGTIERVEIRHGMWIRTLCDSCYKERMGNRLSKEAGTEKDDGGICSQTQEVGTE